MWHRVAIVPMTRSQTMFCTDDFFSFKNNKANPVITRMLYLGDLK